MLWPSGREVLHREGEIRGFASLAERTATRRKNRAVVSFRTHACVNVAALATQSHNFSMKPLAGLLVTVGFLFGVYLLYVKRIPTVAEGTASTQAVNLTGVKMDLLQIAKAERNSIGVDGHSMAMDELLASGSMSFSRPARHRYSSSLTSSSNT